MTRIRLIHDWVLPDQQGSAPADLAGAISTLLSRVQRGHQPKGAARTPAPFSAPLTIEDAAVTELASFAPSQHETLVLFLSPEAHCRLPSERPSWVERCAVIPVVQTAADAANIRDYLRPLNAVVLDSLGPAASERLADTVVSTAAFRHTRRAAFISYRRKDGRAVALQLAARLNAEGFETFLDEQSIPKGRNFNLEIGYRLNDADLVLMVVSPDADHSPYMHKEINFANRASIGLLALDIRPDRTLRSSILDSVFPDQKFTPTLVDGELEEPSLDNVMRCVFELRVAALVRRLQSHVPAARAHLARAFPRGSVVDGPAFGEFAVPSASVRTFAFPHRPTLEQIFAAHRAGPKTELGIFHPENVANDPRVVSMRWALLPWAPSVEVHHVRRLWRK